MLIGGKRSTSRRCLNNKKTLSGTLGWIEWLLHEPAIMQSNMSEKGPVPYLRWRTSDLLAGAGLVAWNNVNVSQSSCTSRTYMSANIIMLRMVVKDTAGSVIVSILFWKYLLRHYFGIIEGVISINMMRFTRLYVGWQATNFAPVYLLQWSASFTQQFYFRVDKDVLSQKQGLLH